GRGSNMAAILDEVDHGILHDICRVSAVVSNRSDAAGLATAKEYGVETRVVESSHINPDDYTERLIAVTASYDPDLIVLAGYMKILHPAFIRAFEGRIVNIHPADTSLHQGLHAYEWAFDQGLDRTYITVHYVDEGVDTGAVIGKAEVDLRGADTLEEVEKRGLAVEHCFYSRMLAKILQQ
ncbi:MAG: phosphoribosylglycinamide formyltransferase, partial [Spirochaetota bacterium]